VLSLIYPLHKSLGHAESSQSSLVVSWQRIYNSLTVTTTYIKFPLRRLTPLYSFNSHSSDSYNCQLQSQSQSHIETSLFVVSYDSQGHGGGIRPRLHTGLTGCVSKSIPKSKSKSHWDWRSLSQSVLVSSPHLGLMTRYLLLFDSYSLLIVGRPLWREDGSVFCQSHCLH
jgi:hypothetical protein